MAKIAIKLEFDRKELVAKLARAADLLRSSKLVEGFDSDKFFEVFTADVQEYMDNLIGDNSFFEEAMESEKYDQFFEEDEELSE